MKVNEPSRLGLPMSLEQLVAKANELLPRVLPDIDRLRQSELNPRLVRHFSTLGLLDEAGRAGREARYGVRHLLQLLVVRRLMAEGSTTVAVKGVITGASDSELEELLVRGVRRVSSNLQVGEGGAGLSNALPLKSEEVAGANDAPAYLAGIRQRSAASVPSQLSSQVSEPFVLPANVASAASPQIPPPAIPAPENWQRIRLADGLELHIRADFRAPNTPYERESFLHRFEAELKNWGKKLKGKSK